MNTFFHTTPEQPRDRKRAFRLDPLIIATIVRLEPRSPTPDEIFENMGRRFEQDLEFGDVKVAIRRLQRRGFIWSSDGPGRQAHDPAERAVGVTLKGLRAFEQFHEDCSAILDNLRYRRLSERLADARLGEPGRGR